MQVICPLQHGVAQLDQLESELLLSHGACQHFHTTLIAGRDEMKTQQRSLLSDGGVPAVDPLAALPAEPGHSSVSCGGANSSASHDGEAELRQQLEVSPLAGANVVV